VIFIQLFDIHDGVYLFLIEVYIYDNFSNLNLGLQLNEESGYFFHVKMPGYRLASLAAATTLHFTARCIQPLLSQNPTACIAYLGGSSQLPISSTGAIILS
jgi:hypothetical protein